MVKRTFLSLLLVGFLISELFVANVSAKEKGKKKKKSIFDLCSRGGKNEKVSKDELDLYTPFPSEPPPMYDAPLPILEANAKSYDPYSHEINAHHPNSVKTSVSKAFSSASSHTDCALPHIPNESSHFLKGMVQEVGDRLNSNRMSEPRAQAPPMVHQTHSNDASTEHQAISYSDRHQDSHHNLAHSYATENYEHRDNSLSYHNNDGSYADHESSTIVGGRDAPYQSHSIGHQPSANSDHHYVNQDPEQGVYSHQRQSYEDPQAHYEDLSNSRPYEVNDRVQEYEDYSNHPSHAPPPPPMHKLNKFSHQKASSTPFENVHHSSHTSSFASIEPSSLVRERVQEINYRQNVHGSPAPMPNPQSVHSPRSNYMHETDQDLEYGQEYSTHGHEHSSNYHHVSQSHLPTKSVDEVPLTLVQGRVQQHERFINEQKPQMPALKPVVKQEHIPEYRNPEPEKLSFKQKLELFENKSKPTQYN
ncbi:uncharacterized protein LOC116346056 [Contarinia nasturtii]|uniref:uncharacterized protein LOC116346056 n=1 Tax=Contarinia nasturtii TaxID=265458 RepID=UPI0012D386DC|nr:uncharacterized protein LOC116346056 [Contarinia nasturtii]